MAGKTLPRIALLALIWGSGFLWIKLADRGFSPVEVTFARLATGAAVLFAVMLARRDKVPRSPRLWAAIVTAALFANAVPYLLFAVAEQSVSSSTAGIINATTPLWTAALALAVRHQKGVTRWQAAGLVIGFAGGALIFAPWRATSELLSAGGLECLAASVSYAVSYIYMDRFLARRGASAIVLSACQLAAAAVMLAVALAVAGVPAPRLTAESVAAVAVLGIIGTGLAYVLNYQIIASDGATVASTVTYLLPVIAIAARGHRPQRADHRDHPRGHGTGPGRGSADPPAAGQGRPAVKSRWYQVPGLPPGSPASARHVGLPPGRRPARPPGRAGEDRGGAVGPEGGGGSSLAPIRAAAAAAAATITPIRSAGTRADGALTVIAAGVTPGGTGMATAMPVAPNSCSSKFVAKPRSRTLARSAVSSASVPIERDVLRGSGSGPISAAT